MRAVDAQMGGTWQAELSAPDDWSAAQAAFVAWLAREGRSRLWH
ncbi:MAG: hypothetical protein AB7Q16_04705 [Vicinamibacterales bacterium]